MEKLTLKTGEFIMGDDISEEEKIKAEEKSKRMQEKLQQLGSELESAKDNDKLTPEDVVHKQNRNSRDKYRRLPGKTRNTKDRINEFENL